MPGVAVSQAAHKLLSREQRVCEKPWLDKGVPVASRSVRKLFKMRGPTVAAPRSQLLADLPHVSPMLDAVAAMGAIAMLAAVVLGPWMDQTNEPGESAVPAAASTAGVPRASTGKETVVAGYVGAPWYYRSDLRLQRPDGTDLELKRLGWDGDALYFPIDGGARLVRWSGPVGYMIDFMHNKAIARLGKGAHGREIENGVVEDVETAGSLKGKPAPERLRLTDLFDRLEFTHGHNVLLVTGMARLPPLTPHVRPYLGIGVGVAVPHVEVWFAGEKSKARTNEYQYAGPAAQLLAGLELRHGRGSYFIEYKFIWASISAALTGGESWSLKKVDLGGRVPRWLLEPFAGLMELPGDLWRQLRRSWSGTEAAGGSVATRLSLHEVVLGAGYAWPGSGAPAP